MSIFNSIPLPKLKRSKFNLSHDVKLTANMGTLVPVLCQPVLPGDKWNVSTQFLCRTSPMLAPVMHRINIYFHTFFVPNRLLWENWEDFITQGVNGEDKPVLPYTTPKDIFLQGKYTVTEGSKRVEKYDNSGSLADYLGLPVQMFDFRNITPDQGTPISLLPFAAYQLIYDEYYKDENLETEEFRKLTDGYNDNAKVISQYLSLRSRCWRKDYFAGALPWPQRLADSEVTLPIAGEADVKKVGNFNSTIGKLLISETGNPPLSLEIDGSGFLKAKGYGGSNRIDAGIDLNQLLSADQISKLKADISTGNSVTINQLREAVRLQIWLENNARGGSRYIEQLMAHFGVQSSDARLQRPEYLGGYSSDLNISEVLQTSESTENSPQGKQTGHGFSIAGSGGHRKYFEEHGYIMTIMSIRPQNSYMQGIPKDFTKTDNLEFYFPEFQHLGEQEVKEKEIYYIKEGTQTKPVTVSNEDTFGYVPRYAEYKTIPNRVCGDFRDSMDYYHLARKFDTAPTLSSQFMHVEEISWRPRGSGSSTDNPVQENLARIFATFFDPANKKPYQHYWFDIGFDITCSRKMSKYGIPKLI